MLSERKRPVMKLRWKRLAQTLPSPFGQGSIDCCSTHTPAASFFFFGRIYARRAWFKAVTNVDNTRPIVRVLKQSPSHSLSVRTFGQALIKGKPTKSLKWNKNRLSEKYWLRPLLPSPSGRGSIDRCSTHTPAVSFFFLGVCILGGHDIKLSKM